MGTKGALEFSRLLWPQGPRLILCGASNAVLEGLSHADLHPHVHGHSSVTAQDIEMVGLANPATSRRSRSTTGGSDQDPANKPLPLNRLMSLSFRVSTPSSAEPCPPFVAVHNLEEAVALARRMVQAVLPASNAELDESKDEE